MATQRRKNRIKRKVTKAESSGNYGRANNLTNRLGNIATREGNRSVGNTLIQRAATGLGNTFRNASSLPAKNLTANASGFTSKATLNPQTGRVTVPNSSISSPQTALQKAKVSIYDTKSNRGGGGSSGTIRPNLQNSGSMQSNMGFAGNSIVTGSSFDPTDNTTISYTPKSEPTLNGGRRQSGTQTFGPAAPVNANEAIIQQKGDGPAVVTGGGSTTSSLRVGSPSTASATGTTGSTASASGSGLTIAPAGSEGYLGGYDYALSNEERARQKLYEDEQAYYEKQKNERVDKDSIMRDTLRQFQGEIDAANSVFAGELSKAKILGDNRLRMTRAENFNAGAENSSFGNAAQDRVIAYNTDQENAINNEKLQLIASIESEARVLGEKYYQDKKAAKEAGFESYMASLTGAKSAKEAISNDIAANMIQSGVSISELSPAKLESIAKSAGVSVQSVKSAYETAKELAEQQALEAEQEAAKAERESQFNLSEGQARYDSEGNLIASRAKTYAPSSGSSSSSSTSSTSGVSVSPAAQSYIDRYNSGSATLDDILKSIPGVGGQGLRDEISMAIASQSGTLPDFARNKLTEAQSLVNELLLDSKGKRSAVGSSFGKLVGTGKRGLQPKRVGFETKAQQLAGILTLDNLGVLKGPLSDADREFIQVVSSGQNLNMSEADFDANLRRILAKLDVKLGVSTGGVGSSPEDDTLLAEFGL